MGMTTPAIGIYIPAAGETNYSQSFAAGMYNIDQHDHSGEPNKGLPIATEGLGNGSVTYPKLNANVADPTTGIGTSSILQNQLIILDLLKNIFQLPLGTDGFITKDGILAHARIFEDSDSVTWVNRDGIIGNPKASVNIAGISPVPVANGGTGLTSLSPYDILLGGTSGIGNVQQVVGEGTSVQYLASAGLNNAPSWQDLPVTPPITQNLLIATLSLTNAQFTAITSSGSTNVVLVPAQGAGKVVVINQVWGKVTVGADRFHSGSSVHLYWGTSSVDVGFVWTTGSFTDSSSGYYYPDKTLSSSSTVIPSSTMENRNVTIGINSTSFSGGSGSTATFWCSYSVMQI